MTILPRRRPVGMGQHWSEEPNPFSLAPTDTTYRATVTVLLEELLVECRGNRRRLTALIEEAQHAIDVARTNVLRSRRQRLRRPLAVPDE